MRLADLAADLAVDLAADLGHQVELLASGANAPAMSPRIDRTRTLALQIHLHKREQMPKASSHPRPVPGPPRRRKTLKRHLLERSLLEGKTLEQPRRPRAIERREDSSVSAAHGLSPTASTACS